MPAPHHDFRNDQRRGSGGVVRVESEGAKGQESGAGRGVVELGQRHDVAGELGPPFGCVGNAARLVPNDLPPTDHSLALADPGVGIGSGSERQQRAGIVDLSSPRVQTRRAEIPGHAAQRSRASCPTDRPQQRLWLTACAVATWPWPRRAACAAARAASAVRLGGPAMPRRPWSSARSLPRLPRESATTMATLRAAWVR